MTHWLVLDVDGVVLDVDRGGAGHWTNELERRHGIDRASLRDAFFVPYWDRIVTGARPIEPLLASALAKIGADASVESVLRCWFEADFVAVNATIRLARRARSAGARIALATNQEPRRAAYLTDRLGELIDLDVVVASADIGHRKPEAAFFVAARERFGIGGRVVFVDDTEANVVAARAHGWEAVHAGPGVDWIADVERRFDIGHAD